MSETKMLNSLNITMVYTRPHNMFPKVFPLNPGPEKNPIKWPNVHQNRFAEGDAILRVYGFGGHLGCHLGFWKMHTFKLNLPSRSCLFVMQLLLQVKPGSFSPLMLSLTFSWKSSQASNTKLFKIVISPSCMLLMFQQVFPLNPAPRETYKKTQRSRKYGRRL